MLVDTNLNKYCFSQNKCFISLLIAANKNGLAWLTYQLTTLDPMVTTQRQALYATSFSVFHMEATVSIGLKHVFRVVTGKRTKYREMKSRHLIHTLTVKGLRHTDGPVQTSARYIYVARELLGFKAD